jgi:phage/plasmid primase-like uncharacterized protein
MTRATTNEFCGIHRTFLLPDGSGKAGPKGREKMILADWGVIRLIPDEDMTIGLGICEGIETGLSIIQAANWRPVWACGSAAGIAEFPVIRGIESLTIFADNDTAGINAANKCAARWAADGREVRIIPPRDGDWNDVVRAVAA